MLMLFIAIVALGVRTAEVIDRSVARIPMYQALATIKIETSNKTVREIVDEYYDIMDKKKAEKK